MAGFGLVWQFVRLVLLAIVLFAFALGQLGCSHMLEPETSALEAVTPLPFPAPLANFAVRTGGTLRITYLPDSLKTVKAGALHMTWTATAGSLSVAGLQAQFKAPPAPDTVRIAASLVDESGQPLKADTLAILVYNQLVMLKADDFLPEANGALSSGWQKFIFYVMLRQVHCGCGLIGYSLESGGPNYARLIRNLAKTGMFEFWNHGYTHRLWDEQHTEFKKVRYTEQYEHILRAQRLAKERTGITMHTFGAPGNAFDENTLQALEQFDEIKVWLFGDPAASKLVLEHTTDIEHPTSNPSYAEFIKAYRASRDYLVLQIHPRKWNEAQFAEFFKVMDFLFQQQVTFVMPYEYFLLQQPSSGQFRLQKP